MFAALVGFGQVNNKTSERYVLWFLLTKLWSNNFAILDVDPILFSFRVKFYPADPFRLAGNGRLMLYQQLKRDLRHGRLYCSTGEAAALGALIVQGEIFRLFVEK